MVLAGGELVEKARILLPLGLIAFGVAVLFRLARPRRPYPARTARATRSVPKAVRMARYSRPVAAITAEW